MDWTAVLCPFCRNLQVMRGTHVCRCGQKFKLPRRGRYFLEPEEDQGTLFYLPSDGTLVTFTEMSQAASRRGVDLADTGGAELPVAWFEASPPSSSSAAE